MAWSFATVSFLFLILGVTPTANIVLNTYATGGSRFFEGLTPYILPQAGQPLDLFCYPPFAAMGFGALMRIATFFSIPQWQSTLYLWILLNAFFFWWGVSRWIDLRKRGAFALVALFAAFAELDTSIWYCQVNPLVAGVVLLGIAAYRDGKPERAAGWLALGTAIKVLPGLFALALFFRCHEGGRFRTRFRASFLAGLLAAFFLPALVVGVPRDLVFHREWLAIFFREAIDLGGRLDLGSALAHYGHPLLGALMRYGILVATLAGVIAGAREDLAYEAWVSLGLAGLLLASPRTEQPTFVLLAPVYLLLGTRGSVFRRALALGAAVAASLGAWRCWHPSLPHGEVKTFAALVLWVLAAGELILPVLGARMRPLTFLFRARSNPETA
jgi:hypothetical protein